MKSKSGGKKEKEKSQITHYQSRITNHRSRITDHASPIADRDTRESPVREMVKELKEFGVEA